jgi:hypothetical protein
MLSQYARWLEVTGSAETVDAYAGALKMCRLVRAADPAQNELALTHAWIAMRYGIALHVRGRTADSRQSAAESLAVFEQLVRAPKAGYSEWNNYASELLACPFPDLCDAGKALAMAEKAVELTKAQDPFSLDTLANAYFRTGDPVKAVEASRKAKSRNGMMPKAAREEIDANLRRFEASLPR